MNLSEKWQTMLVALQTRLSILNKYPDLEETKDRFGNVRLVSKKSAADANEVEFGYSCECCADAEFLVFPYHIISGIKIYSNGEGISIGKKLRNSVILYPSGNKRSYEETVNNNTIARKIEGCVYSQSIPIGETFEDDYWGLFQ